MQQNTYSFLFTELSSGSGENQTPKHPACSGLATPAQCPYAEFTEVPTRRAEVYPERSRRVSFCARDFLTLRVINKLFYSDSIKIGEIVTGIRSELTLVIFP